MLVTHGNTNRWNHLKSTHNIIYLECFSGNERFMMIFSRGQYFTANPVLEKGQIIYWTHTLPDLCLCSPYKLIHHSDASLSFKKPYLSNKECSVLVTRAAVTLNPNFSFRFTSLFTVPNLIWSSFKFI